MEFGLKPLGREKFWLWALLTPTLIGLLFGALGSVIATVGLSFAKWDLLTPPTWAGLANYVDLFQDQKMLLSLTNTIKFTAFYVPGVVIVSLLIAVLMNRKVRGVGLFRTAYFLPAVTSAVATALVWNMIYGKDTGILNFILERLGMQPVCWLCTENALYAVILVNIWGALGEGMIRKVDQQHSYTRKQGHYTSQAKTHSTGMHIMSRSGTTWLEQRTQVKMTAFFYLVDLGCPLLPGR